MPKLPPTATALLAAAGLALASCGGEDSDDTARATRVATPPDRFISVTEAEGVIEAGDINLVRTGLSAAKDPELEPKPITSIRYESATSREFDVLLYPDEASARRAWPSAVDAAVADDEEPGSAVRALNVVAVFPESFRKVDSYRSVARALRGLAAACTPGGDAGDPDLTRLCGRESADPAPAGEGVDTDEAARIGATLVVDGIGYTAPIARQLNPRIKPDEELVGQRLPADGKLWFGVFVRACNWSGETRPASEELALVDAFGKRIEPTDLPESNPFGYEAAPIEPDDCLPAKDSVADRVADGSLVLFEVTDEFLAERPIAFEVTGDDGTRKRVLLDL